MSARQKLKLTKAGKKCAAAMSRLESIAPAAVTEARVTTLAEAKQDAAAEVEGDLVQIAHAQIAAQASGIAVDATQASGLVMNAIYSFFTNDLISS
jgi:hypothetical protein